MALTCKGKQSSAISSCFIFGQAFIWGRSLNSERRVASMEPNWFMIVMREAEVCA